MRRLLILLGFAAAATGEETKDLEQPPVSVKARQLREQALALWNPVQPLWELVRTKKPVPAAEAAVALPAIEQAVELFERSLHEEWSGETNRTLANAVRTWCALRPLVPPPAPADDAARQKAEKAAAAAALARKREVRDFITKYAAERRATSLFRACPKCDGRGESASPFGDRRDCAACQKRGRLLDREGILAARWLRYSPLYRALPRHEQEVNKLLRSAPPDAQRDFFAPYIRGVTIKDVEDHDTWARVKAQDQIQPTLPSQKTEKVDATYVLFRVGEVWYLFDEQADKDLLDTKELQGMAPPPAR
jgi:hypothetical protein